jgi:hypothetical protein
MIKEVLMRYKCENYGNEINHEQEWAWSYFQIYQTEHRQIDD